MTTAAPVPVIPVAPAACGRCGYSVFGLTTLTCPECGSDLRTVGILTPNNPDRSGRHFFVQAVIFTAVFAVAAFSLAALLMELLPKPLVHTRQTQLIKPASGRYASVRLSTETDGFPEVGLTPSPVRFELEPSPPSPPTAAAPPSMMVPVASDPSLVSSAVVLAWMKSCGVDVTDPKVQVEARYIAVAGRAMGRRQPVVPEGNFGSTSSGTAPWGSGFDSVSTRESVATTLHEAVPLTVGAVAMAIWIGGLMAMRPRRAAAQLHG